MSKFNSKLTQDRLKEVVSYDPLTGIFTRKIDHANGLKKGVVCGTKIGDRKKYLAIRIDRSLYLCHRLAWLYVTGSFPVGFIDHINGDGFDNRIINLRDVTNEQNVQASLRIPKHNTSGFKGVSWVKASRKWVAGISINNKRKVLGFFMTPEDASSAYLKAKKEMHFL